MSTLIWYVELIQLQCILVFWTATMQHPSYIIENICFRKNGLGTLIFHSDSGEIHSSKVTYQFSLANNLLTNKYFEVRTTYDKDILLPLEVFYHLELISNQLVHCGKQIKEICRNNPQFLNTNIGKSLYLDTIEYSSKVYFYTEIKVDNNLIPICELTLRSKITPDKISVQFELEKFINFLNESMPFVNMCLYYPKDLVLLETDCLRPKHTHGQPLFKCTCPNSSYEMFTNNNKLIKYREE